MNTSLFACSVTVDYKYVTWNLGKSLHKLADKRTFPAIDIAKSGTRKEELLVEKGTLSKMWVLRKILSPMGTTDAMEFLLEKLKSSKNNNDFFDAMNQ